MLEVSRLRVLDLSGLEGQLAGKILADLGLEVVKVEPPQGDPVRRLPPFKDGLPDADASLTFLYLNSNKKSIALNVEQEDGRNLLKKLARNSDVLLESFVPGYLERLGLDYHSLAQDNPGLVVVSITGFGQDGPYARYQWSDLIGLAMGGLLNVFGDPSRPPCKPPETQAYYMASGYAALAALFAIYHRKQSGRGQHIDVSIQESVAVADQVLSSFANEKVLMRRDGAQHKQVSPANVFPCRDGFVYLFVSASAGHWKEFLGLWPNHPATFDAPEWESPAYRRENTSIVNQAVRQFTNQFRRDDLVELMQTHGLPCLPVNTPQEFLQDVHIQARGFLQNVAHPRWGSYQQSGTPFLLDGERPRICPAPRLGQHNAELGVGEEQETGVGCEVAGAGEKQILRSPQDDNITESRCHPEERSDQGSAGLRSPGTRHLTPDTRFHPKPETCLAGIRVLALTQGLAGPFAGMLLAAHGAEVIKVESRRAPDTFRRFGAHHAPPRFLEYNRNVLSITVNLKHAEGPELIKALVKRCDIVLDNFSAPVLGKYGLDYPDLQQVKSDIILLRMPGFGTFGPKRNWQSWGQTLNAFTGLLHLWRNLDETTPAGSQTPLGDYMGPVIGLCAALAALLDRDRTGRGHCIDLSQAEAVGYLAGATYLQTLLAGTTPAPEGNDCAYAAPHDCFPCCGDDRWCVIAVETEEQWQALCIVIGHPELYSDPRYQSIPSRRQHASELRQIIAEWTFAREAHSVMNQLQQAGVPCGVVQNGEDLLHDPHLQARRFPVVLEHPVVERLVYPGMPFRMSATPGAPNQLAPELGQHNEYVFGKLLGMGKEQIQALQQEEVLL